LENIPLRYITGNVADPKTIKIREACPKLHYGWPDNRMLPKGFGRVYELVDGKTVAEATMKELENWKKLMKAEVEKEQKDRVANGRNWETAMETGQPRGILDTYYDWMIESEQREEACRTKVKLIRGEIKNRYRKEDEAREAERKQPPNLIIVTGEATGEYPEAGGEWEEVGEETEVSLGEEEMEQEEAETLPE
jgi:hypothetical protein